MESNMKVKTWKPVMAQVVVNGAYVAYKSRERGAARSSADQVEENWISKSPVGGWCEPVDLPLSKQMPPGLRLPKHVQ